MPEITPIRTDLFRFVTLRTPQLISQGKKSFGFIEHPAPGKSYFLKSANSTDSLQQSRSKVTELTKGFNALRTYNEVMAINPDMYQFSYWLMKNRNQLTADKLKQRVQNAGSLKDQDLLTLWDNLMYQAATKTSKHVRQACIQMIIGNNFVEVTRRGKLQDLANELIDIPRQPLAPGQEEKIVLLIKRLAKAKVVLPMAFSVGRQSDDPSDAVKPGTHSSLVKSHETQVAAHQVNNLTSIKNELQAKPQVLSPTADALMRSRPGTSANDVSSDLNRSIKKLQGNSRPNRKKGRKVIVSRGNVIKNKPDDLNAFTLSFQDNEFNGVAQKKMPSTMYMSMNAGKNASVNSADYSITTGGQTIKSNNIQTISNADGYTHLQLFPGQDLNISDNAPFEINGNFELDNGSKVSVNTSGNTKNKTTNGKVKTVSVSPPAPTTSPVELYGVSNIGVGILRKVEQEVCCYVPGEVSRIENIMAREFKERHTRSLVSTETTEETTSETETENLTDTATTTRNEMQSEVAHVLGEDSSTSMGGSLGVSGKVFGAEVDANAYIDSSSSTSSSTSDSAAKTYAEEVTQRTLERVVQKTTVKRTSRMLQEYEENNRHGFDNRSGDKHVTGVYRWIDIIYTNRLINYGKRLMYEFMLPEPAYFYKQALEAIAEEAGTTGDTLVLEEPVSPADNGIAGPESITEDNYLDFARLYDITIQPPIEETGPVTDSFSPITPPDAKEKTYDFDMLIPMNYQADSAQIDFTFNYHYSGLENNTKFVISVGDNTHSVAQSSLIKGDGQHDFNGKYPITFSSGWKGTLPVQVSCLNVHSFMVNVSANVSVQGSIMDDWQNAAYDQIMRAYEDQLDAYNAELQKAGDDAAAEAESNKNTHESFNRTLEQREIQRLCIEMMTKPFGIKMGKNFYTDGTCVPSIKQTSGLETYASHVKFFEQAFDWENMSYLFYPYYWAAKCDWTSLIQSEFAADPIFQAFLQAGWPA